MAEQMMVLEAVVGMDATAFRRGMANVRNDVGILSSTIGGISGAARTMTLAFTAPMVALGSLAVNAASGFDASMRNINSILQLSDDQFASLSASALDFAKTTRDGVVPATDALYEIFSAGILDQGKAMEIWKVSTKVAEAGVADLSATTNAITATMNAFNLSQDQSTRVGNIWTRMVQVGVGSLGDFLSNAQKILPLSNLLGVSLEDMGSSVAFLSQGGGGAAKAETAFAQVMSNLLKPTNAMTEAFGKLGVASGRELVEKFGTVQNAIQQLKNVTPDETLFNKMFAKTGLEAAGMFITNADKFKTSVADFNKGLNTATMDAWTEQSKSFAFQLDLMKTALTGVATVIGQAIIPLITPVVNGITDLLTSISDTNPQLVQMGVAFVAIVAAAAPVIWLITSMVSPIGLVVGAIGALVTAFATDFGGIRTQLSTDINSILGTLTPLKDGIQTFLDTLFPQAGGGGEKPADKLKDALGFEHTGSMTDFITINPQDSEISLWDFFQGEGFIKKFSWDDFKKMAIDAGWDGSSIKPGEMLKLITPDSGVSSQEQNHFMSALMGLTDQFDVAKVTKDVGGENNRVDNSIGGKIAKAFEAAWPVIQPALENMWSNIKTWFSGTFVPGLDSVGADIFGAVAKAFMPNGSTGKGNTAVYDGLHNLIGGGAQQAGEQVAGDFAKNFPGIASALSSMFENIGAWIKNEGVPTIARSIGYMAGTLSVLVGTALGNIWSSIKGGQTAAGVGQATSVVQDSFLTPLNEGFQQAVGDKGVTNPADVFFTNLSAVLVAAAAAWVIAPAFVTSIISTVGSTLVSALTAAVTGLGSLLGGISIPMLALTVAAVGLTVLAIDLLVDENARNQAHEAITGILDQMFGEGTTNSIEQNFTAGVYNTLATLAQAAGELSALLGNSAVADVWNEKAALWGSWGKDAKAGGAKVANDVKAGFAEGMMNMIPTPDAAAGLDPSMMNPFNTANWNMTSNVSGTDTIQPIIQKINETPIDPTAFVDFSTNLGGAVTAAVQQGNFDGQGIVDTLVTPLALGFETNFGAEAPATLAWTSFIANVVSGGTSVDTAFMLISQDIVLLLADVTKNMPLVATAITSAMTPIIKSLSDANFIATTLSATLASLDGATVTLSTSVSGGVPTDGTHAMGLDRVPYDGYIAELHKGERVLTANEAKDYGNSAAPINTGGQGRGDTKNEYYVTITGVNDLDGMLREARRRGIELGKR